MPTPMSSPQGGPARPVLLRSSAWAKVNLWLAVGPRCTVGSRAGWHPICSRMVALDLHDSVSVQRLPPGGISSLTRRVSANAPRPFEISWPLEHDLAHRAREVFEEFVGYPTPARIELEKSIPPGTGLGGGSSDAAAVLRLMRSLYAPSLSDTDMCRMGSRVGTDVPFFLDEHREVPRPAFVTGFGEHIERAPLPREEGGELVLFFPPLSCPTAEIYGELDTHRPSRGAAWAGERNDLEPPARAARAELDALIRALRERCPFPVFLTGSGCVVVGHPKPGQVFDERALDGLPCVRVRAKILS